MHGRRCARGRLAGSCSAPDTGKAIIAANLPYGIATILLVSWLEAEPWPPWWDRMVLMFQKEVAERIVRRARLEGLWAPCRHRAVAHEARIVMTLKPEAFTPPPKVDSAVVEFMPRAVPASGLLGQDAGTGDGGGVRARRKMLRSSLKTLVPNPEELLDAAGLSPTELRAERLTVRDFAKLAYIYERSHRGPVVETGAIALHASRLGNERGGFLFFPLFLGGRGIVEDPFWGFSFFPFSSPAILKEVVRKEPGSRLHILADLGEAASARSGSTLQGQQRISIGRPRSWTTRLRVPCHGGGCGDLPRTSLEGRSSA